MEKLSCYLEILLIDVLQAEFLLFEKRVAILNHGLQVHQNEGGKNSLKDHIEKYYLYLEETQYTLLPCSSFASFGSSAFSSGNIIYYVMPLCASMAIYRRLAVLLRFKYLL